MLLPLAVVNVVSVYHGLQWGSLRRQLHTKQAKPNFKCLHSSNGSMVERTAFSGGLERVLVLYNTVELFAFKSMAYRLLVRSSAIQMFWGQILIINVYLLYSVWQRVKSLLAVMWFVMWNKVCCWGDHWNSLIHFYSFLLGNMKYRKMYTHWLHSHPQIHIFLSLVTLGIWGEICSYFNNLTFATTTRFLKSRP